MILTKRAAHVISRRVSSTALFHLRRYPTAAVYLQRRSNISKKFCAYQSVPNSFVRLETAPSTISIIYCRVASFDNRTSIQANIHFHILESFLCDSRVYLLLLRAKCQLFLRVLLISSPPPVDSVHKSTS